MTFGHFECMMIVPIIQMQYQSPRLVLFCIKHAGFMNHYDALEMEATQF